MEIKPVTMEIVLWLTVQTYRHVKQINHLFLCERNDTTMINDPANIHAETGTVIISVWNWIPSIYIKVILVVLKG